MFCSIMSCFILSGSKDRTDSVLFSSSEFQLYSILFFIISSLCFSTPFYRLLSHFLYPFYPVSFSSVLSYSILSVFTWVSSIPFDLIQLYSYILYSHLCSVIFFPIVFPIILYSILSSSIISYSILSSSILSFLILSSSFL